MTENEYRMLRQHPNMDTSDMNKLLEIARLYDVSAKRQRILHDIELTKHKERLLGQNTTATALGQGKLVGAECRHDMRPYVQAPSVCGG